MRVHHLNCVSACPVGGMLVDGMSAESLRGRLVSHCLLLETSDALVLVDTGYGLRDVVSPCSRLSKRLLALMQPQLRVEMTALRQIERLGFDQRDVRHIVLSHLDYDHAGGLDDFPHATVHLLAEEVSAAALRRTALDRMRYRPQQWSTRAKWQSYRASDGESWYGFNCVRGLQGLSDEVMLVPLTGHTLGHAGVAIRRDFDYLFYAGDAYYFHAELDALEPHCPPALRAYQALMEKDRPARLLNRERLRALRDTHSDEVKIFCAHDVCEFEFLSGRSHHVPAPPLPIATDFMVVDVPLMQMMSPEPEQLD